MKEKSFQSTFSRWCKYYFCETAAFELKLTKKNNIPFSAVVPHQVQALLCAKHSKLIHKIPDLGNQNPFDSFILHCAEAYVVIMFYKRGQKEFIMIDIDEWVLEDRISKRRSLTEKRAKEIGKICYLK